MADIYTQRAVTDVAKPLQLADISRPIKQFGSQMQQEANQDLNKARDMYITSLDIDTQSAMNDIFAQNSDNPAKLNEDFAKLSDKMYSSIEDDEVKQVFLTNFEIKKGSYLNKAKNNFRKAEAEKFKSVNYNAIYAANDTIGLSLANALNGAATADDVINYTKAEAEMQARIGLKNNDGTYLFSDSERLKLKNDSDKAVIDNFMLSWSDLPEAKKADGYNKLKDDSYMISIEDKQINIKDLMPPAMYKTIKEKAFKERKEHFAQVKAEQEFEWRGLVNNYITDRTPELMEAIRTNPFVPKATKEALRSLPPARTEFSAVTSFSDYDEAIEAIKTIADFNWNTEEGMIKGYKAAFKVIEKANTLNLNEDDFNNLKQVLVSTMGDKMFAERIKALPDYSNFKNISNILSFAGVGTGVELKRRTDNYRKAKDIEDIGHKAIQDSLMLLADPTYDHKQGLNDIYQRATRDMLRVKYREIPEIQGNLEAGKTILHLNGRTYRYMGFGKDIIVEELN